MTIQRIPTVEDLKDRIGKAMEQIKWDERYPESLEMLAGMLNEEDFYDDLEAYKLGVAESVHETDGAYPMHPAVVELVTDIYEDAIDLGSDEAMCNLGSLYYTGRAGEQNYEKAAHYYDMADKAGNRQATENLGYIYYYGRIGERDYEKAFKYFVKGALDGHLRSLYKVGDFYRNGYYVEKDPKEAFRIYDHCLKTMTDEALPLVGADVMMRLGDCYFEGIGVEEDLLAAQHYMSMAENMFYKRLMEGDFYQQKNLEHVLETEKSIREQIKEKMLPDLSWAGYNE